MSFSIKRLPSDKLIKFIKGDPESKSRFFTKVVKKQTIPQAVLRFAKKRMKPEEFKAMVAQIDSQIGRMGVLGTLAKGKKGQHLYIDPRGIKGSQVGRDLGLRGVVQHEAFHGRAPLGLGKSEALAHFYGGLKSKKGKLSVRKGLQQAFSHFPRTRPGRAALEFGAAGGVGVGGYKLLKPNSEKTAFVLNHNFTKGFEKTAETSKTKKGKATGAGKRVAKTLAAVTGLNTGAALATLGLTSLDSGLSMLEQQKLVDTIHELNPKTIKPSVRRGVDRPLGAYYSPIDHVVEISKAPKKGVAAHELGHATSKTITKKKGLQKLIYSLQMGVPSTILRLGGSLPHLGLFSGNEKVRDASVVASGLINAPALIEEARASYKGLRGIQKAFGTKAALRAAPSLMAAGLTYASIPASAYVANKWIGSNKEKQEPTREKN